MALSVQMFVHVLAPAGERSNATEAMPPPSEAVALSVTAPVSGVPGAVSDTVGTTLSTRLLVCVVANAWLPATSVATARSS